MTQEYDRFAKQLWVKVYQEELTRSYDNEEAKNTADLAISDYMNSIHGVTSALRHGVISHGLTSVVNENFTTGIDHVNTGEKHENYYDELQKLRQENADLQAENERLKEQNENLDVAYMAGMVHARKDQSADITEIIKLPFELDRSEDVMFKGGYYHLCHYLNFNNIDQTKIKRILLEMKSEDE